MYNLKVFRNPNLFSYSRKSSHLRDLAKFSFEGLSKADLAVPEIVDRVKLSVENVS